MLPGSEPGLPFGWDWMEARFGDGGPEGPYELALEAAWTQIRYRAVELFVPLGYAVTVEQMGRSGGWAVLHGLPTVEDFGVTEAEPDRSHLYGLAREADLPLLLGAIGEWIEDVRAEIADLARATAWHAGANYFEAEAEEEKKRSLEEAHEARKARAVVALVRAARDVLDMEPTAGIVTPDGPTLAALDEAYQEGALLFGDGGNEPGDESMVVDVLLALSPIGDVSDGERAKRAELAESFRLWAKAKGLGDVGPVS